MLCFAHGKVALPPQRSLAGKQPPPPKLLLRKTFVGRKVVACLKLIADLCRCNNRWFAAAARLSVWRERSHQAHFFTQRTEKPCPYRPVAGLSRHYKQATYLCSNCRQNGCKQYFWCGVIIVNRIYPIREKEKGCWPGKWVLTGKVLIL